MGQDTAQDGRCPGSRMGTASGRTGSTSEAAKGQIPERRDVPSGRGDLDTSVSQTRTGLLRPDR